jgi:hypothetical protein
VTAGTYPAVAYGGVSVYGGGAAQSSIAPGAQLVMGGGLDYDPGPEEGRCHHRKVDDTYCGRFPKKGSMYCPLHKTADETIDLIDEALANEA